MTGVESVHPLDDLTPAGRRSQAIADVDAPQHEDAIVGLDFAADVADQLPFTGIDTARLQRAP